MLGEVWVRITPTGVEERTPLTDELKMWPCVQSVTADAHNIYLFTEALRAYFVPRRAFSTAAEMQAFLEMAKSYHHAAQQPNAGIASA
jgi:hypothetical protein